MYPLYSIHVHFRLIHLLCFTVRIFNFYLLNFICLYYKQQVKYLLFGLHFKFHLFLKMELSLHLSWFLSLWFHLKVLYYLKNFQCLQKVCYLLIHLILKIHFLFPVEVFKITWRNFILIISKMDSLFITFNCCIFFIIHHYYGQHCHFIFHIFILIFHFLLFSMLKSMLILINLFF